MKFAAVALIVSVGAVAPANALSLQIGKDFSFYSSSNCQKIEVSEVDLALDCNFGGKRAQFYLRESKNTVLADSSEAALRPLLACAIRGVGGQEQIDRIKLWGGSAIRSGQMVVFNWYGLQYSKPVNQPGWSESFDKRVLLRAHYDPNFGTGVLVAISDVDPATVSQASRGVAEEVMTVLGSLGPKFTRVPQP